MPSDFAAKSPSVSGRNVLLIEFNEINWPVIDQLTAERGAGFLPNFNRLRLQGTCATPVALETPPDLDPWVTWVTVHTGVAQEVHGAKVLEQDVCTVAAARSWEYAHRAGRSVGVFGSIGAYPPNRVNGFMVPGPFAPSDDTYPSALSPIQSLNRGYTRAHGGGRHPASPKDMVRSAMELRRLGLKATTCGRIAGQLLRERLDPHARWRRVVLQPLVNYDIFAALYRKHRPAFATWHSNHAAHYMHHYWRAWSDAGFQTKGPEDERRRYGEAVPTGYKVCDDLLGKFLRLAGEDTVLLICSSMGQQPFVSAAYRDGKVIVRFKNIHEFLGRIGAQGVTEVVPTMVPQANLRVPDARARAALASRLRSATRTVAGRTESCLAVAETGEILTVTPLGLGERATGVTCDFPPSTMGVPLQEFFAMDAPTVKQGMHHPDGLLIAYGKGIEAGKDIGRCSNLDIAPTVLTLLGVSVPEVMRGRVLLAA